MFRNIVIKEKSKLDAARNLFRACDLSADSTLRSGRAESLVADAPE